VTYASAANSYAWSAVSIAASANTVLGQTSGGITFSTAILLTGSGQLQASGNSSFLDMNINPGSPGLLGSANWSLSYFNVTPTLVSTNGAGMLGAGSNPWTNVRIFYSVNISRADYEVYGIS
jgi:hypothetical protein